MVLKNSGLRGPYVLKTVSQIHVVRRPASDSGDKQRQKYHPSLAQAARSAEHRG
jgi:hypothetical protein